MQLPVQIHVLLLNEGVTTAKLTKALDLQGGYYQILQPDDYDPEDEEWEFLPGSIVRCEYVKWGRREKILLAVEKLPESEHATIDIFVELLDEGTCDWIQTQAIRRENGLYEVLAPPNYNPEFYFLEFLPGDLVKLKHATLFNLEGFLAIHPDPNAIKITVLSSQLQAPKMRETHAIPVGDGLYRILPTPHYIPEQLWEFPPDSIVRVQKKKWAGLNEYYLLAVDPNKKPEPDPKWRRIIPTLVRLFSIRR